MQRRHRTGVGLLLGAALFSMSAPARADGTPGSAIEAAGKLKPGDYLWAPEIAPRGPLLFIVSLATQRATLYRNGIPIAITTVSTGKAGHRTPVGVFTILQREVKHFSSIYDNAPMPYMQRLTWGGVALHGGTLPGYPASHGCIRLPHAFARLLYGATRLGMTVIVTNAAEVPRIAPSDPLAWDDRGPATGAAEWHPERSPAGSVSLVISAGDQRIMVLRNGIVIGSAPARIDGPVAGTTVFVRRSGTAGQETWLRVELPEALAATRPESFEGRIRIDPAFRALVEPLLEPGTSVIITTDSLRPSGTAALPFRLEDDSAKHSRK
ncbi:L,D-transpeptidase [Sphingopyxis fribergensis]